MEDEMGHIIVDWDDKWKIPPTKIGPSEKQNPKVQDVNDDEEEGEKQDRGNSTRETIQ
jgi:hypothetical protein